jgi:hypothetical protein
MMAVQNCASYFGAQVYLGAWFARTGRDWRRRFFTSGAIIMSAYLYTGRRIVKKEDSF